MEKTLIVLKPDAVQRGIVGEVLTRFEKVGLKIVGMKMVQPTKDHYYHHYETIGQVISRRGQEVFDVTLDFMMEGPVVAVVLGGIGAAELVRKMVGSTEPKSAAPGTIRGDYTHMSYDYANNVSKTSIPNVIHASGDAEEAKQEIAHWFAEAELFNYETVHEQHTQPKSKKKK
jgi:nucleoside-diphosphate kinase